MDSELKRRVKPWTEKRWEGTIASMVPEGKKERMGTSAKIVSASAGRRGRSDCKYHEISFLTEVESQLLKLRGEVMGLGSI